VEAAIARATALVAAGDNCAAGRLVEDALASAPPGNAGWTVPIEPLLDVAAHREVWTPVLARLRSRAR
jgi:hypothetical protein